MQKALPHAKKNAHLLRIHTITHRKGGISAHRDLNHLVTPIDAIQAVVAVPFLEPDSSMAGSNN
jgi:hypothetical protein